MSKKQSGFDSNDVDALLATGGGLLGELSQSEGASLAAEEIERWLGVETGPYRISEFIDRGGMSLVFSAERCDGQFEQQVAIKILQAGSGSELSQRFERERQLLARLEHPGIAHIIDSGLTEGQSWIAMELVDGMPIDQYCDVEKLTLNQRLALFVRVAQAVQFAHGRLVVHRDLKPSNILVSGEGQPKLLDFGIAKALERGPGNATLTGPALMMTPMYASPEQVLGEPVGVASDIYQLGLVLYRLLTGSNAQVLDKASVAEIKQAVVDTDPPSPSACIDTKRRQELEQAQVIAAARSTSATRLTQMLHGDLDAVVLKALEKDPTDRYRTVQQLVDDVERYRASRPVLARAQTRWYRSKRFIQRHRGGVLASTLVGIVVLGSLIAVVFSGKRTIAAQEKALAAQQQALIEAEATRQVGEFVTDLLAHTSPGVSGGEDLAVTELLADSVERVDQLADTPIVHARVLETIARAYLSLTENEQAKTLALRALQVRETSSEPVIEPLTILTDASVGLGDLESAEKYGRQAVVADPTGAEGELVLAEAYAALADTLFQTGEYADERAQLERALELTERVSSDRATYQRAELLSALGRNAMQLGRYQQARQELQGAAALLGDAPHEWTAKMYVLRSLGGLYSRFGDEQRAIDSLSESLALGRKVYGADNANILGSLVLLGRSLGSAGHSDEAERLFLEAIELAEKTIGKEHGNYARVLFDFSLVLRRKGEFERRREIVAEASEVADDFFGQDHSTAVNLRYTLALSPKYVAKYPQALRELEQVLPDVQAAFGEHHLNGYQILVDRAELLVELGEFDQAWALAESLLAKSSEIANGRFNGAERTRWLLARLHGLTGSVEQAVQHAEEALAVRQQMDGGQGFSAAASVLTKAEALAFSAKDLARVDAERALELIQSNHDRLSLGHYLRLARFAPTAVELGLSSTAREWCRDALERARAAVGNGQPLLAHTQLECAEAVLRDNDAAAAQALLEPAIPILAGSLGPDNWQVHRALVLQAAATGDPAGHQVVTEQLREALGNESPYLSTLPTP